MKFFLAKLQFLIARLIVAVFVAWSVKITSAAHLAERKVLFVLPDAGKRPAAQICVPANFTEHYTAVTSEHVIEGNMPSEDISSFLDKKPVARGWAVLGMPGRSTDMGSDGEADKYDVLLLVADGTSLVYANH